MAPFQRAVELFPYVFHPITVLAASIVLLIRYEWRQQSLDGVQWRRIGAFLGAGVLSLTPTVVFYLLRGGQIMGAVEGSSWQLDIAVAAGVYIVAGVVWFLWRRYDWGAVVPDAMVALAAVMAPYVVLSPFWDVSGHVIIALMPTLYLALLDRTYVPLLAIPILMVPNRVLLEAHTVAQSTVAFVLAGAITLCLYYYSPPMERQRRAESTPQ